MKNKFLMLTLLVLFFTATAQAATVFTVNSTNDGADSNVNDNLCQTATAGECSLRAAIEQANFTAGADTINFNISGAGVKTITPLTAFPDITQTVTIDGYTQPGTSPNTLSVGNDAVLLIEIDGGSQNTDLFHFFANNNNIRGLVINRAPFDGIFLGNPSGVPTTGNVVEGNFIGTDPTGTIARGNGRFGVSMYFYPSANNLIGGTTPASRNLISGNGQGVVIALAGSTGNLIIGNYIGTNASGAASLPNGRGIFVGDGASNNLIGGTTTNRRNVISGNFGAGVLLTGNGITNNDVRGNRIGTTADGTGALGNFGYGVGIGDTATGNTILSNQIFANDALGIDLGGNGVTPNDAGDPDTGINNLQNFPVLTSTTKNGVNTTIQGTLNSTPNTNGFIIEFFVSSSCDSTGNGEGQRFLGSTTVNTDGSGNASFNQIFAATIVTGEAITTTATNPSNGDTSEFSQCRTVVGTPQTFVVTTTANGGAGSLRQAITNANANNLATDTISFNIAGAGVKTISPITPLPDIIDPVVIDGYTQPGASVNTAATTDNAVILIELDGTNVPAGSEANGLRLTASGSGSTVRGLAINRFPRVGISLNSSNSNIIAGNFIGTDSTGMLDLGNGAGGILNEFATPGSLGNLVGGTAPANRNIVSGNGGDGGIVFDFAAGTTVQGNFVGLAADGATVISNNGSGVYIGSFTNGIVNIIGGDDAADGAADGVVHARNFISGNTGNGIFDGGAGAGNVIILGNYIGTDTTGTLARPNAAGIATNLAHNSIIGGGSAGAGNLISGNTGDGINIGNTSNLIVRGNRIGTRANGTIPLGNGGDGVEIFAGGSGNAIGGTGANEGNIIAFNGEDGVRMSEFLNPVNNPILSNSIFSNGGLGIDLDLDGVTPNDAGDADAGANNKQNFPVITGAQPGNTRVVGTLNSTANSIFRLEFFNTPTIDASGNGEGQMFIGTIDVTTDGSGNAVFDENFVPTVLNFSYISATATNLMTNETSEFSNAKIVLNPSAAQVSISGRVLNASGRGVFGAVVALTDANGNARETRTNFFGFYRFEEVGAGETYVISVTHKRFEFTPQVIPVSENLNNLNFVSAAELPLGAGDF